MVPCDFHTPGHLTAGGADLKAIDIRSLSYSYDDGTEALKDVSLDLDEGEKLAVVGPNGAGKSTLIHLLAGFRTPFEGEVFVAGQRLAKETADKVRRSVGLVFQDPEDQIFMPTVEEDVAFGPLNLSLDDVEGRVTRALRAVGIEHIAKRGPHHLSYGMKKRVAIAGVLAMDPKVLLLDEPTSGLDPRSRSGLVQLLKDMDRSMLIATHDLDAAAEIVDRVVVLNVSVTATGTLAELLGRPEVLERAGLELPSTAKVFKRLREMGYPVESLPASMDQSVAAAVKLIDKERETRSRARTK